MDWSEAKPTSLGTYWRKLGNEIQLVALLGQIDDLTSTWLAVPNEEGEYDLVNPKFAKGVFKRIQTNDDICTHILGLTGHKGFHLGLVYFDDRAAQHKDGA